MNIEHKFFGYGLFLDTDRLVLNKPNECILGPAFLPFHKLIFDVHATIVKTDSEKDTVWGILYKINSETLNSLDMIEGYPIYYNRSLKTVFNLGGKIDDVIVYHMRKRPNFLFYPPDISYFNLIKNKSIEHKFPPSYIDYLNTAYRTTIELHS